MLRSGVLLLSVLALRFGMPDAALAQDTRTGSLEGTVTDSVHARPLTGAKVFATLLDVQPESRLSATTDNSGRFRFERLTPGRYALGFESALLDSLEFGGVAHRVTIEAGRTARLDLAIPSGQTLRGIACPGINLDRHTGAVVGLVSDADSPNLLGDAEIAVAWSEMVVDSASRSIRPELRATRVRADSAGQYSLCGVPTGEWLLVQVQHAGRAGAVVRTNIVDAVGVTVLNLSYSASASRTLATERRTGADTVPALLTGTATLAGTVRAEGGQALAGVQVRVLNTAPVAHTDERGEYVLTGLPAGTHEMEIRQLGYGVIRKPVDLRSSMTTRADARLEGVVSLDSVSVVAQRPWLAEFENRRKESIEGKFLTQADIERLRVQSTSDIFASIPGFTAVRQGPRVRIYSARSSSAACPTLVFVDRVPAESVNEVPPSQIAAMEFYPSYIGAPMAHRSQCGTIMIWTKL